MRSRLEGRVDVVVVPRTDPGIRPSGRAGRGFTDCHATSLTVSLPSRYFHECRRPARSLGNTLFGLVRRTIAPPRSAPPVVPTTIHENAKMGDARSRRRTAPVISAYRTSVTRPTPRSALTASVKDQSGGLRLSKDGTRPRRYRSEETGECGAFGRMVEAAEARAGT